MTAAQHAPLDMRTAEAMLAYVDGCEDRDTWVAIGMSIKAEFGEAGYDAWDRWSANAGNYNSKACRASWRGFKARAHGYTIGTLIKLAKDGGYRADPSHQPDMADLARRRAERAARVEHERAERAELAQTATQRALASWKQASQTMPAGGCAYAQRKLIDRPESVRFMDDGSLVIPMIRYDLAREHALKGVQIIRPDGSKKFTYGMEKPGTACRLGLPVVGDVVFVAEGWATGMSLRMALDRRFTVFVAFDAYNLPVVVQAIHQSLPTCPIVICADDDWKTERKGIASNTGRIQAQVAMDGVMDLGAKLVVRTFPVFGKATARADKDTDFNDLHRLEGLCVVRSQLELCMDAIQSLKTYG